MRIAGATRRVHRILGIVLLLPICAWSLTGFVFFVKPGYAAAYAGLRVREYPLEELQAMHPTSEWREARSLRTILGPALLIRTEQGWSHLDPGSLRPRPLPDDTSLRRLLADAIASETARYGEIISLARHDDDPPSATFETSTGVTIELDWSGLSLQQSGRDTRRIDRLYRVHYLQWTGIGPLDRVLGVAGLLSLITLAILGLRLVFGNSR